MRIIPNSHWIIIIELLIANVLCLVPIWRAGVLNEYTLLQGTALVITFLIPAELFRFFWVEQLFEKELHEKKRVVDESPIQQKVPTTVSQPPIVDTVSPSSIDDNQPYPIEEVETDKPIIPIADNASTIQSSMVEQPEIDEVASVTAISTVEEILEFTQIEKSFKVYINASPENRDLADTVMEFMEEKNIDSIPPVDFAKSPTEIRQSLETTLRETDVIVLLSGNNVHKEWVLSQFSSCQRVAIRLNRSVKWVLYGNKELLGDFPSNLSKNINVASTFGELLDKLTQLKIEIGALSYG